MNKKSNVSRADFEESFEDLNLMKITTDDRAGNETCRGFIIGLSDVFVATLDIREWHSDGLKIYPIDRIESCVRGEREERKEAILLWNDIELSDGYVWLDLSSFEALFASIQKKEKTLVVAYSDPSSDGIVQRAQVGIVKAITKEEVHTEDFDVDGDWNVGVTKIPFSKITDISIDDEYSTVLRAYADLPYEDE